MAGGHVEFEAPRTEVINGSTARPTPMLMLLESLIAAKLLEIELRIVNKDKAAPIGSVRLLYMVQERKSCFQRYTALAG